MWIEALKNHGRSVLLMLLISFTSMFQLGYVIGYPNTAFDSFKNFINESLTKRGDEVNENQFNWIWSAMLSMWSVGFLIGTVVTPFIAEKYGRKVSAPEIVEISR
uniref:Major facilitator superfamily (MFS) profile domain-containing protein n=1 Tax=Plectus sambesii TaxID=2011161 RepID=A0A914V387_9BILA